MPSVLDRLLLRLLTTPLLLEPLGETLCGRGLLGLDDGPPSLSRSGDRQRNIIFTPILALKHLVMGEATFAVWFKKPAKLTPVIPKYSPHTYRCCAGGWARWHSEYRGWAGLPSHARSLWNDRWNGGGRASAHSLHWHHAGSSSSVRPPLEMLGPGCCFSKEMTERSSLFLWVSGQFYFTALTQPHTHFWWEFTDVGTLVSCFRWMKGQCCFFPNIDLVHSNGSNIMMLFVHVHCQKLQSANATETKQIICWNFQRELFFLKVYILMPPPFKSGLLIINNQTSQKKHVNLV